MLPRVPPKLQAVPRLGYRQCSRRYGITGNRRRGSFDRNLDQNLGVTVPRAVHHRMVPPPTPAVRLEGYRPRRRFDSKNHEICQCRYRRRYEPERYRQMSRRYGLKHEQKKQIGRLHHCQMHKEITGSCIIIKHITGA
jgi:hypothetical protein